jgi:ribosomal protein S24E
MPEKAARAAIDHEATATPSREKVKLTLTVFLDREQAERLAARAIREGKNLEGLVAEILEAEEAAAAGDEGR